MLIKMFFPVLLVMICIRSTPQEFTKYFDNKGQETTVEKAVITAELTPVAEGYKCLAYWSKTHKSVAFLFLPIRQ